MNASSIKAALRLKYAAPHYATLEEVRNATGKVKRTRSAKGGKSSGPRYADMIAVGLWPSIGLEIIGFEVKTTRADWLNEISDEKKAVAVQQWGDPGCCSPPHHPIHPAKRFPPRLFSAQTRLFQQSRVIHIVLRHGPDQQGDGAQMVGDHPATRMIGNGVRVHVQQLRQLLDGDPRIVQGLGKSGVFHGGILPCRRRVANLAR